MLKSVSTHALAIPVLLLGGASLTACSAQGYGHGSQFAGANCVPAQQACGGRYGQSSGTYGAQQSAQSYGYLGAKSRYGTSYQAAGYQQEIYAHQQQMMLRATPSYDYAPQSYASYAASSAPSYDVSMYTPAATANTSYATPATCPAGTTAQSDGTCLQGGSTASYSSVATAPSYSSSTSYTGGYMTGAAPVSCPAGTTSQADGTCLQGGSASYSASSSYSPSYSSSSSNSVSAPAISTYDWGSNSTAWGGTDYVSPGTRTVDAPNSYPSTNTATTTTTSTYDYTPVRK